VAHRKRPTSTPPTLPAGRAFVVQLRADADLARGVVHGRIEHVVSGVAAVFESLEDLVRCMQDALARVSQPPLKKKGTL
jgi:hypothetical protein